MKLKALSIFALLLTFSTTSVLKVVPAHCNVEPRLYVDPLLSFALLGETFTIGIKVVGVAEANPVHTWQVGLVFNSRVLSFVNVTEGDFLTKGGWDTLGFSYLEEAEDGFVMFTWAIKGSYSESGSGTLANVEFLVLEKEESILNITNPHTYLIKMNPPPIPPGAPLQELIPCTKENGYFICTQLLDLYNQLSALNSSYYSLLAEYQDLLSECDELELDFASLLDNYTQLQTDIDILQDTYDDLNDSYGTLRRDYDNLQNIYSLLNSTSNSLKTDYADLKSKHETITGAMETARSLNYVFVITTLLFVASTTYFLLRKPK